VGEVVRLALESGLAHGFGSAHRRPPGREIVDQVGTGVKERKERTRFNHRGHRGAAEDAENKAASSRPYTAQGKATPSSAKRVE